MLATDEAPSAATVVLASRGQRLSGHILEMVLFGLTLGLGWAFWFASTGRGGQTPAKRLLGMRVVDGEGRPASLRQMVIRDVLLKVVAFVILDLLLLSMEVEGGLNLALAGVVAWLAAALWCVWDGNRQCLWDKAAGTRVEVTS
ncbi:MAG: RDD family protein [Chloroflexota bacterium]|nr:RDD family protein [Chloroflexota bacterium]